MFHEFEFTIDNLPIDARVSFIKSGFNDDTKTWWAPDDVKFRFWDENRLIWVMGLPKTINKEVAENRAIDIASEWSSRECYRDE